MKWTVNSLLGVLCCCALAGGQHPTPLGSDVTNPGIDVHAPRIIDEPLNVPRPDRQRKRGAAQLKRDAETLAQLAQAIPADVALTQNGALPKDLLDRLKRIEKLSRHLRHELSP